MKVRPSWDNLPSALSLAAFVLVIAGQGGKALPLWHGCALILLAAAATLIFFGRAEALSSHPLFPAVLGFSLWALLPALAAPCAYKAFLTANKAASAVAFGVLAWTCWRPPAKTLFRTVVIAVGFAQACLFAVGRLADKEPWALFPGSSQYGGFWLSAASLLALGAYAGVEKGSPAHRRPLLLASTLFLSGSTLLFPSRAGGTALLVGAAFFAARRWGFKTLAGGGFALAFLLLLMPPVFWGGFLKSGDPMAWRRGEIWASALSGIAEKPLLGWGAGGFEGLYEKHARPQEDQAVRFGHSTPFAHNDYLQAAAEFGVPAAAFLLLGVFFALARCRPAGPMELAEQSALAGAAVFLLFNFPLVLPANALLLSGLTVSLRADGTLWKDDKSGPARPALFFMACLFSFLALANVRALGGRWAPWDARPLWEEADRSLHAAPVPPPEDVDRAEALMKQALSACPAHPEGWHALAHLYSEHAGPLRRGEAVRALERALAGRPTQALWWMELSRALEAAGALDGAAEAARQALRLEPYFAQAFWQTGRIYRLKGERDKAVRWLRALQRREGFIRGRAGAAASPYAFRVLETNPAATSAELALALKKVKK